MFRNFLLSSVLLGFAALATAAPITFTESEYSVTATASVGPDPMDLVSESDSTKLSPLPLSAKADSSPIEGAGTASAGASAVMGKLTAMTSVTSTGADSIANSTSRFSGTIDSMFGGIYQLAFNFITDTTTEGLNPFASSTLFVTINSVLNNFYDNTFNTSISLTDIPFSLAPGESALFDITLISDASSTSGSASNAANVDFSINAAVNGVPEPHEGLLLLLGGLAMYNVIRRGRRRVGNLLA